MKKILKIPFMLVLVLLVLLITACGNESTSTSENDSSGNNDGDDQKVEELRLRASSGISAKHFWHVGFFQPFMDRIENESNGSVEFEVFTSGELVSLGTEYDALRQGSIDVALTFMAAYDPQRFPYTEVTMLPLLESDASIAATAIQNMMKSDRVVSDGKTYYEIEFGDKDLIAFANPPTEPYVLTTTKTKFETKDDFTESIRVRSPSRVHEILANNLGITPISMPITDSYDALSRNALDGMFYNIPDWMSMGFDELLKHTIEGANLGHFVGHLVMTKETWDKLPTETQENIKKAADELIFNGANVAMEDTIVNIENNISKGGEFTHLDDLDPSARDHINKAIVKTWFDWIDKLESQQLAGKEMALLWRDMLIDAGAVLPQEIMDME